MSKSSKKCRIFKDGNSWCCVGPKFKNLQESASGFGDTPEESYTDYQADVIAMKAAKKLAKAAKKAKKVVSKKFKDIMSDSVRVLFIKGLTMGKVMEQSLRFNLTMECPLGNDDVSDIVSEIGAAKEWLGTTKLCECTKPCKCKRAKPAKKKSLVSKILKAGGRNNYLNKVVRKAFGNGTNRAGVISMALTKNMKFNPPLQDSEVTNIVRIEWERLNPPSK